MTIPVADRPHDDGHGMPRRRPRLSPESLEVIRRDNDERLRAIARWQRSGDWGLCDNGCESTGERMLREASADCRDLLARVQQLELVNRRLRALSRRG